MDLVLKMSPSYQGDLVVGIFDADPNIDTGDTVNLKFRHTTVGTLKVRTVEETDLAGITNADLRGSIYTEPTVFWARLESELKTGLPAEFPLWVVTFGPDLPKDQGFEEIEEATYEAPPPKPKAKAAKKAEKVYE